MSETEIITRSMDQDLQAILTFYEGRVHSIELEHEVHGRVVRQRVTLMADAKAAESSTSSYDSPDFDVSLCYV